MINPPDTDFVVRFKTELRNLLGEDYDEGAASEAAVKWWNDPQWSGLTPEEVADWEASEYGPE